MKIQEIPGNAKEIDADGDLEPAAGDGGKGQSGSQETKHKAEDGMNEEFGAKEGEDGGEVVFNPSRHCRFSL